MTFTPHPNGGGLVEDTAHADASAYIGPNARVSGTAHVYGNAVISGNARVSGPAQVYGTAQVSGNARVSGTALVSGTAQVSDTALIYGNARVFGNARVYEPRHVLTIGPIGSENQTITLARTATGHTLTIGCWTDGTLDTLKAEVMARAPEHWPEYRDARRLLIRRAQEWEGAR